MVEALFVKALEAITSETIGWAGKKIIRTEEAVALLRRLGIDTLEDDFESIYAYCLVGFATEGKPKPLIEFLRNKDIVSEFKKSARSGKFLSFFQRSLQLTDGLALGDELKSVGIDIRRELERFQVLFMETTQKARTPGNQQTAVLLEDIRDAVRGPKRSLELSELLRDLAKDCESRRAPVTQLHLFHRLLSKKLDCFHPPLVKKIKKMLDAIAKDLESPTFVGKGYGMTDTVTEMLVTARAQARQKELPELDTHQVLLTMMDALRPDSNVTTVLNREGITAQQIIGGLRFLSPKLT